MDVAEEAFYHIGQARDGVEVLLALFPDDVGSAEHTLCHFAEVARSPELAEQVHNLLCVVRLDRRSIGACAALVVGDDSGKSEYQALRQFAFALQVGLQAGQVAGLEFREGVEHDAGYLVVHIRVVEALQHIACELAEFVHRQVEGLHEFLELHFVDILSDNGVVASVAHDVDTAEVSHRREDGVGTVEQGNLTLVVGFLRLSDEHMQPGFLCGELLAQLLNGHVLGFLDNPEVEYLGLHHEVVVVAHFLLDSGDVLAGEARHDTVHEGSADIVVLGEPLFEALIVSAEVFFPEFDILIDALFEVVSVEENQLAGHEDKSLGGAAVEGLVAAVEQLHKFARVCACRCVGELARGVKGDTRLGGVRDDEADVGLLCQCHESGVLRIGVEGAGDHIDTLQRVHGLAVEATLQVHVVEAVLSVEPLYHAFVNRLYHYNGAVEVGLGIHIPDNPIYKCAEEVAFAELDDTLGCHALGGSPFV